VRKWCKGCKWCPVRSCLPDTPELAQLWMSIDLCTGFETVCYRNWMFSSRINDPSFTGLFVMAAVIYSVLSDYRVFREFGNIDHVWYIHESGVMRRTWLECESWILKTVKFCVLSFNDRLCGLLVRVPGCRLRGPGFSSRRNPIFWVVVSGIGSTQPLWV
jgi:hypothetical protein